MKDRADPTFGLNHQAMAILHYLASIEPAFAKYENGYYDIRIQTFPWYNGREKGVCLVVQHGYCGGDSTALHVTFGEIRNSDGIFVDHWVDKPPFNCPTLEGADPDTYEKAYHSRMSFGCGEIGKAADYIQDLMEVYYKAQEKEKAKKSAKKD